ncbi:MAG: ATP phosphoribosyltransferase regulatory subunit [Clostridia bacterium]|nr:ATP phosphoribosyltransferase regulatory subunit [Clostridia bacterium]
MDEFLSSLSKEDSLTYELSMLYKQWGYKEYRMAKFEEYSFYSDNRDFLSGKGILAFNNSYGRLMALKPDITLSIVKNAKLSGALTKLYYNESVFRMTDSSMDYKEIKQTGVEVLGKTIDEYLITEVLMLAAKSLKTIDKDFVLCVSHMAFIPSLLSELEISANTKKDMINCIKGKNIHDLRSICEKSGVDGEKAELLATLAGINGKISEMLPELCRLACNDEMKKACEELEFIAASLKKSDLADKLLIDLSVLNNTEYYNGIIFQGYVEKAPSAVLTGGRYDKLAGKIRENTQAIGFAVYLDNLNFYYKKVREYDSDILILFDSANKSISLLSLVESFVEKGFSVRVEHTVPDGYKAKTVYAFENGALREVSAC